jgi:long-chain acyl-CoA synthetase
METLLDLLDRAVGRFGDRPAVTLANDDGTKSGWSYRELERRSRLAAWRLRAGGLGRGDRILTWSPSAPDLPAAYFGAMRAGLVIVPLDLRMAADAIERIAARADARRLVVGSGRDAPDPAEAGLDRFETIHLEDLVADPDQTFPADWETQLGAWPRPKPDDVFELVFTSGTTGDPKGVMLAHDNVLASVGAMHHVVPPMDHRIVSLLPLSHLFEQAVALLYALDVGADILYVRSRNPRLIFEAIRGHRMTSMVLVPQILELFWTALVPASREAAAVRCPAADLPTAPRAAGRRIAHLRVLGCLPPAVPPAGLGRPRRDRHPGLRVDRDGFRHVHDARRSWAGHGRAGGSTRPDAARRGR